MEGKTPVTPFSETEFYDALNDAFVGFEASGPNGFINLMRLKSKYFKTAIQAFKKYVSEQLENYPNNKEEFYDVMYRFFNRFINEDRPFYFGKIQLNEYIYERIPPNCKDVSLFWKTQNHYYVQTARQISSVEVKIGSHIIYFDTSTLDYSKSGEKVEFIYRLKGIEKGRIILSVKQSARRRKPQIGKIVQELKEQQLSEITSEKLDKAIRIFEQQTETDYFINKDLNKFLKEQFDLWLYHHIFSDKRRFSEQRINELKSLQKCVYKFVDLLSQFENKLLKLWQKPKFVRKSNYIISLNHLVAQNGGMELFKKITKQSNFITQIKEWQIYKLISKDFHINELFQSTLLGRSINPKYKLLPLDTSYFSPELKIEFLTLFNNLDKCLDGWIIHSDNWQALNTILDKFKNRVKLIYIDPPFNTGSKGSTMYLNRFSDTTWLSMMKNTLKLAKEILNSNGSIYVRMDYHGNHYIRFLMDDIFGEENFRNKITIKRTEGKSRGEGRTYSRATENLYFYSKNDNTELKIPSRPTDLKINSKKFLNKIKSVDEDLFKRLEAVYQETFWYDLDHRPRQGSALEVFGFTFDPPKGRHWINGQEKINEQIKRNRIRVVCTDCNEKFYRKATPLSCCKNCQGTNFKIQKVAHDEKVVNNDWTDIRSYSQSSFGPEGIKFPTENSELLLKRVIEASSEKYDLIMDFFLGSGTTIATAQKLGRKWIGIEMGDHFKSIILPRMKELIAGRKKNEISKSSNYHGGGFFKYYTLEQFESILQRVSYEDQIPLNNVTNDLHIRYLFLKDDKLLETLKLAYQNGNITVALNQLYDDIDIHETISNLRGKFIKSINGDVVVFEDEETINVKELDYKLIKPLIWW
ncbi:MAG: site-specific DNA-methyltransferase [Promethearchaeota archaeon]